MTAGFPAGGPRGPLAAARVPGPARPPARPLWVPLALPLALLLALALALVAAAPARAAGYRYWAFWERTGGSWQFAQSGPASVVPEDGTVEGWRFAVSADSAAAAKPRGTADFAALCGHTPAVPGKKRVALVLDFGTRADSPDGTAPPAERTACARVPSDASAADALAAVGGPLRYDASGLVCGIAGYPAGGCGQQAGGGQSTAARGDGTPLSVGVYAGIAVVVLVGGGALWQARRRRRR